MGLICLVFLASCDPMQTIEIQNKLLSESTIKFYFSKADFYEFDEFDEFDEFLTKDSLILTLAPHENKAYHFGIGTWEINNSIDSLISRVDKVEIVTENSTERFTGKNQISTFFITRLDDSNKAGIIIEIK
jgi:hypothetical protein